MQRFGTRLGTVARTEECVAQANMVTRRGKDRAHCALCRPRLRRGATASGLPRGLSGSRGGVRSHAGEGARPVRGSSEGRLGDGRARRRIEAGRRRTCVAKLFRESADGAAMTFPLWIPARQESTRVAAIGGPRLPRARRRAAPRSAVALRMSRPGSGHGVGGDTPPIQPPPRADRSSGIARTVVARR